MVFLTGPSNQKASRSILKLLEKNLIQREYVDYQYLHLSKIPTKHFQSALPRLPIPNLNQTCQRYLAAQRPLLIDEAYRKTEANVTHFRDGAGVQLQKLLKEYDNKNKHTSYISELWFDKYLRDRQPLPLNYNPALVLHNDDRAEYNDQAVRTTNLIISSLRFYKTLNADLLEPEVYHLNPQKSDNENFRYYCSKLPPRLAYLAAYLYKAFPLDMSQYPNLFNTTRIPEIDKDRIISKPDAKHITVQYKGNFYAFDVLSVSNDILAPAQILERINTVLSSNKAAAEFPVGIFTTMQRNKWATLRHELGENNNEPVLKIIDSALFHVCLDDEKVGDDPHSVTKQYLHGDGTNRWFDKSFSLIMSKDGVAGVNFEHSWGDGVAVLRYVQDIFKDCKELPRIAPGTNTGKTAQDSVQYLDFKLNDNLKTSIKQAKSDYKKICDNLDVNHVIFDNIGKNVCKKNKVSPDAIMQLGFQVAYHRMAKHFVSTYESCSTAAFKHGRTEAIRPCTTATQAFTLAVNGGNKGSNSELKEMIVRCSDLHNNLIKEAAMGQGFDRHLFALKTIGEKNGIECNIFNDPEYAHIHYDVLSTSTLNSPAIYLGGFAPVVKDGYGIGYVIKDAYLGALVTNYKDSQKGSDFISALQESLKDIFSILNN